MCKYDRRKFTGLLLAAIFRPDRLHGQPPVAGNPSSRPRTRTYRADAIILFLGLAIYRRAGVGGGQASMEETGDGTSLKRTFFFAGSSDPKRAHGLSRLGWMREVVTGPAAAPAGAEYFGVLTSSPEESLEHARRSADAAPTGHSLFSAVSGRNTAGHSRSGMAHFEYATGAFWSDDGLIQYAQSSFQQGVEWHESSWPGWANGVPSTFLWQMAQLLQQGSRRAKGRYVYNEQEYSLELERLPADRDRKVPVRGSIRNLRTGRETTFRIWLESGSDSIVPVRIEFQPRSFLRLTFEALPG